MMLYTLKNRTIIIRLLNISLFPFFVFPVTSIFPFICLFNFLYFVYVFLHYFLFFFVPVLSVFLSFFLCLFLVYFALQSSPFLLKANCYFISFSYIQHTIFLSISAPIIYPIKTPKPCSVSYFTGPVISWAL